MRNSRITGRLVVLLTFFFILAVAVNAGAVYVRLRTENERLAETERLLEQSLNIASEHVRQIERENSDLRDANSNLSEALGAEQAKNSLFEMQIQEITGTVGTLKKLSQTDRELLKKYSKVYFLSENYSPASLILIEPRFLAAPTDAQSILTQVSPFLSRMLTAAEASGVPLRVVSGYRSFHEQQAIKTGYAVIYGSGANSFSADQGYSEHQLGTTVDLTSPELARLSLEFEYAPAYDWLLRNAYRFGFVLSYPKSNAFYQFEPWHWRFVGATLATELRNQNKSFYDLSQRDIDAFLISLFDE